MKREVKRMSRSMRDTLHTVRQQWQIKPVTRVKDARKGKGSYSRKREREERYSNSRVEFLPYFICYG